MIISKVQNPSPSADWDGRTLKKGSSFFVDNQLFMCFEACKCLWFKSLYRDRDLF